MASPHPYDPADCNGCGTVTAKLWLMADETGDSFYCSDCVQQDPGLMPAEDLDVEIALVDLAVALRNYRRGRAS